MKKIFFFVVIVAMIISCQSKTARSPIVGTWKLISGTLIEKGDTTVTNYSVDREFIKIINDTHFSFIAHDLGKGRDSSLVLFTGGAGPYKLVDSTYTEHLQYCSDRDWEDHDFTFTVTIIGDTLVQRGVEKVEAKGVDRLNIERYVRYR